MQVEDYAAQTVEASEGFASNTVDFGVKNPAVIFDMLCNRMYRNARQTMVQEYMCNARDAHREIANDAAIEVTLPTTLHPYLSIRDFGPGLTPDRMKDVFVFLGESTKRENNQQTGGFGIGAKVGWAYGDSFTIVSITGGKKRTYLAFMGDNNIGKLSMTSEIESTEVAGVEIQIHIKEDDYYNIESAVNRVAYFWKNQPTVHNRRQSYTAYAGSHRGAVLSSVPFAAHEPLAVVDGIPYPMDSNVEEVRKYKTINGLVPCLFFDVGEIDLAVNRESMRYSDTTLASIDGITDSIRSKVDAATKRVAMTMSYSELKAETQKFVEEFAFLGTRYVTLVTNILKMELSGTNGVLLFEKYYRPSVYEFTRDFDLISEVKSKQISSGYGATKLALTDAVYVYHGTGMPPKGKAAMLFKRDDIRVLKIVCISSLRICNQLWSAGMQNYNDLKDAPKVTTSNAPLQGLRMLRSSSRLDMENFDANKHYYVNYKVKAEYESLLKDINYDKQAIVPVVPTLDQLPALLKQGIRHLDVALLKLRAKQASALQRAISQPVKRPLTRSSHYSLPDVARSMVNVCTDIDITELQDARFEEFYAACQEVVTMNTINASAYNTISRALGYKARLSYKLSKLQHEVNVTCDNMAKDLKKEYPLLASIDYNCHSYYGKAQKKQQQVIAGEVLFYINGKYKGC